MTNFLFYKSKLFTVNVKIISWLIPSGFSLTLSTHLHPISCLWQGGGTNVHVLFFMRASYSNCMTACHSGIIRACLELVYVKVVQGELRQG